MKDLKRIKGDASFRKFFRKKNKSKNSVIVFAKKEKTKNLLMISIKNKFWFEQIENTNLQQKHPKQFQFWWILVNSGELRWILVNSGELRWIPVNSSDWLCLDGGWFCGELLKLKRVATCLQPLVSAIYVACKWHTSNM